jgi:hypothetical protein
MAMKISLLHLVMFVFVTSACRSENNQSSVSADQSASSKDCACEDLECWSKKTDAASSEQFECAGKLLKNAADLSTGGTATVIQVGLAAAELLTALQKYENAGLEKGQQMSIPDFLGGLSKICESGSELASKYPKATSCTNSIMGSVKSSCKITASLFELANMTQTGTPREVGEKIWKILPLIPESFSLTKDMITLGQCFGVPVGAVLGPIEKMLKQIESLLTVAECSAKSASNIVLLIHNTKCLGQDIANLSAQQKSLVEQNIATKSVSDKSPAAINSADGEINIENLKTYAFTHAKTLGANIGQDVRNRGAWFPKEECEKGCEAQLCKSEEYKTKTAKFHAAGIFLDQGFVQDELFKAGCFRACIDIGGYIQDQGSIQTSYKPSIEGC